MDRNLKIAFHSSDMFSPVLGTAILSILENNKSFESIDIYVLENGISQANKERLMEIIRRYNRNLIFIPMPDVNKDENLGLRLIKSTWKFDSYSRMFLDKYLPKDVKKVLYMDSDVLVVGDLTELWNTDLKGCPAGFVRNCVSKAYFDLFGMSYTSSYCNSGVVLIDLVKWHEMNIGERTRKYVQKNNGYVFFMEQTVLSAVLQDEAYILHPKYNALGEITNLTFDEMTMFRKPWNYYDRKTFNEAKENPIIIHMTTSFLITNRGWYKNTNHPVKEIYRKYCRMTPWGEDGLFEDTRSAKKKAIQFFVDLIPRIILFPLVSFAYNHIRVSQIKKQMNSYETGNNVYPSNGRSH